VLFSLCVVCRVSSGCAYYVEEGLSVALSSLAPPHVHCHLHVTPLPDPSQFPLVLTHPQQARVPLSVPVLGLFAHYVGSSRLSQFFPPNPLPPLATPQAYCLCSRASVSCCVVLSRGSVVRCGGCWTCVWTISPRPTPSSHSYNRQDSTRERH
jgi:hypothetical protein